MKAIYKTPDNVLEYINKSLCEEIELIDDRLAEMIINSEPAIYKKIERR